MAFGFITSCVSVDIPVQFGLSSVFSPVQRHVLRWAVAFSIGPIIISPPLSTTGFLLSKLARRPFLGGQRKYIPQVFIKLYMNACLNVVQY